ncbi:MULTISPECIES: ParA family protein [Aerosakkonema]|uniref:ParA family protein n=1 Tax=Aerosakkonema TaxID=1246629 RepID=UPI0035BA4E65
MTKKIISMFNNKGGVGKTTIIWNLGVALAAAGKKTLLIDFDPQCNLSIATIGYEEFAKYLETSEANPFGKTIRSYAQPYIYQMEIKEIYLTRPKYQFNENTGDEANQLLDIVPGDFWLNSFADILTVGTDVVSGAGLYRFLVPLLLVNKLEEKYEKSYDYVLIDLPPSFNTLVRSALYCSDYFLVPCTPDLFSAYCIGLIGEVLPKFVIDWKQGQTRFTESNPYDQLIPSKGKPKFGGWIFNGFDTRKGKKLGADKYQYEKILNIIKNKLIPALKKVEDYECIPEFVNVEPISSIEDLNVMAPDSIGQNVPIKYLSTRKPTRDAISSGAWTPNQTKLMQEMDKQYDRLAKYIIEKM